MSRNNSFWITIVRHGRTEANDLGQIQGHSGTKLNETGVRQAQAVAKKLASQTFDRIYTSDLARAYDTAREIVRVGAIHPDARLRERSFGSLNGQPSFLFREQCRAQGIDPEEYTPAGGETPDAVRARVHDFIQNQLLLDVVANRNSVSEEPKILLVTHRTPLQEMITYFHSFGHESWSHLSQHIDFGDTPPNGSVNEFKVHLEPVAPNSPQKRIKAVEVIRLYDDSHLEEQGLSTDSPTAKQMQQQLLNGN